MRYKTVIWDFNGTILSDMGISIDAMNTVLDRRGLPQIEGLWAFRDVFGFPVEDYYARLGFDFSKEPYKKPADEWVALYSEKMFEAPLIEGIEQGIKVLKAAGISQIVLSASEKGRLTEHLKRLSIDGLFDEIHGTGDVYAKGKADLARALSKREELFPCVLVGDTDHDKLCADTIGCDCILFSGGFMSKERLCSLNAPVYGTIDEIIEKILSEDNI